MLRDKGKLRGIVVISQEESYTFKCSCLDKNKYLDKVNGTSVKD